MPVLGFPGHAATEPPWERRRVSPVFGTGGMVASGHPLVSATGLDVLRRGGNAVDAAVAAGLVAAVVLPEMCGLGGDLFALVRPADRGTAARRAPGRGEEVVSVQGSGIAPRGAALDQMRRAGSGGRLPTTGPLSVTVPGMVHAYFTLLDRFGTRSFADLVGPAVGYAEGHPISPVRVAYIEKFAELLGSWPASAKVFLPDGGPPRPGSVFRQTDLAQTLEALASGGPEVFYRGEIADRMCRFLADSGGALSRGDFEDHDTATSAPLATTYRGHTVYQTNLPSQGLAVLEALNIAECFDLSDGPATADGIHTLVEATRLAFADRHGHLGDPASVSSPVERLLSKEWAVARAESIGSRALTEVTPGRFDDEHTTYLCVVDGDGTMVSLIQSVAANFGSGLVAGDTRVVLNNRAQAFSLDPASPNAYAPGKRPMHTLNCYLVADGSGTPVLVGGTPGGDRQIQWNVQVLSGLIDSGWDVQQAIEQPLWIHDPTGAGGGPAELTLEARADPAVFDELRARGHHVTVRGDWLIDSVAQVIARDSSTGVLCGGSDPRTEGAVLAY